MTDTVLDRVGGRMVALDKTGDTAARQPSALDLLREDTPIVEGR